MERGESEEELRQKIERLESERERLKKEQRDALGTSSAPEMTRAINTAYEKKYSEIDRELDDYRFALEDF